MGSNYEKGLYKQLEETFAEIAELKASMQKMKEEHEKEIAEIKAAWHEEVSTLKAKIKEQDATIEKLTGEKEMLTEEVTRLKSIINNDSNNSSNPPSTDEKAKAKKANEMNGRKKSDRRQGAQKGHKKSELSVEDAKRLIDSGKCEHEIINIGNPGGKYKVRYRIDMKVVPVVTEYHIYEDEKGRYPIPVYLRSLVTYGNFIKTFVVSLYGIGVVSNDRIADFIRNMTKGVIRIATGTVYSFCRNFSEEAKGKIAQIEETIRNQTVIYTDATVVTVNGELSYIRNVSTNNAVCYYALGKKTFEAMGKIETLAKHTGIMMHDHETALYHFPATHAECNVHILRYLLKNSQDTNNSWSDEMSKFLIKANKERKSLIASGVTSFSSEEIAAYSSQYDSIIEKGFEQNDNTKSRWARKDERALLSRLKNYKDNHLLFLSDFSVSFDNNMSERDLRKCKNRQKMAGGFRTFEGCQMFCTILSIIETAKRSGAEPFESIAAVWVG